MEEKKPFIYFGHHKCATNWYVRVIQDCCAAIDMPTSRFNNWLLFEKEARRQAAGYYRDFLHNAQRSGSRFLCITDSDNAMLQNTPFNKGFHVVRDPRDIIVSAYFSHIKTHGIDFLPGMEQNREALRTMSKEEGLHCVMSFLEPLMDDMRKWEGHPDILELKTENVTTNPEEEFKKIFSFLGLLPPSLSSHFNHDDERERLTLDILNHALDKNSFKKLSGGRAAGDENTNSHYRKGTPGDWINHFNDGHVKAFKAKYNDLLIKLGYEHDPNWTSPNIKGSGTSCKIDATPLTFI